MQNRTIISVIIPFFNAEGHIKNCLASLLKQKAKHLVEIIMVNDGSTDKSLNIIKSYRSLNIKLFQNKKNLGPAASRNLGLKFSSGDYIYFLDADDELESDALESFSKIFNEKKYDLVFTDKKRILNSQNLRENIYEYDTDKTLDNKNIIDLMKKRFFYPHESHRIFDLTGKFIKRDIILNNKISFDDELRYLEDECFMWSVLSFVNEAKYLKKQSYNYNIRHNESSGISEAFTKNFNITNFLKVKKQVEQSLEKKKIEQ